MKFLFVTLGEDFALIENPGYVFPGFEIVPLAKKSKSVENIIAAVMDMDGTTTTTEVLCIHSLEYMIRQITGRMTKDSWSGLILKRLSTHNRKQHYQTC